MKEQLIFDVNKVEVVAIDSVRPNSWNPKDKETPEFKKVVKSLELYGQRLPIVVRENEGFEIIDGEQRWKACKELGYEKIIIYNEGKLEDKRARELTLWYEVKVPFNEVSLAALISKMVNKFPDTTVPFSQEKIEEMKQLTKFNFDNYKGEAPTPDMGESDDMKTLMVPMTGKQYEIVQQAFAKVKGESDNKMTDARATELICADYLAGE